MRNELILYAVPCFAYLHPVWLSGNAMLSINEVTLQGGPQNGNCCF